MASVVELPTADAMSEFIYAAVDVLMNREAFERAFFELSETLGAANPDTEARPIYELFDPGDEPYLRRQAYRATVTSMGAMFPTGPQPMTLMLRGDAPIPIAAGGRVGDMYNGELDTRIQVLSSEAPLLSRDGLRGTVQIQRGWSGGAEDYRVTLHRTEGRWRAPA